MIDVAYDHGVIGTRARRRFSALTRTSSSSPRHRKTPGTSKTRWRPASTRKHRDLATRPDVQVQEARMELSRAGLKWLIRRASRRSTKNADTGCVRMVEHYSRRWRGCPRTKSKGAQREFYARKLDAGLYAAGVVVPVGTIAPGATRHARRAALWARRTRRRLEAGGGPDRPVDYGIFTAHCGPALLAAQAARTVSSGNSGWAIIAMTVTIRRRALSTEPRRARRLDGMEDEKPIVRRS